MEPKAKWTRTNPGIWNALVGPYDLEIVLRHGTCAIWNVTPHQLVWDRTLPTPCDVTDLMRITEAELTRRLVKVAETMEGGELVAPSTTVRVTFDPAVTSDERLNFGRRFHEAIEAELAKVPAGWEVAETSIEEPWFKVGDLVRVPFRSTSRIGLVTAIPEDEYVDFNVKVDGAKHAYATCDVHPYTLPSINSYADLADVLDELPEGVVVEVCKTDRPMLFRRTDLKYEARYSSIGSPWFPSKLVDHDNSQPIVVKCRIVPPSEAAK